GIATAAVEFGYLEQGAVAQHYCTSRREACVAVASTVTDATPFSFETTDTYSRASCATSCTITLPVLPAHVAYYQVNFYDSGGSFVTAGNTGVVIESIGAGLPSTPTPPTITRTSPLTSGAVGVAYSLQFTATGDTGGNCTGCTWSATGVPGGLTLSSGGLLSGTPTTAATSTINVTATNAAGSSGPTGFSLAIGGAGVHSQATGR